MPVMHFQCPDHQLIPIVECLKKCRMSHRCVSLPTLYTIVMGRREWNGTPSITQLLNGTLMEWLKVKFAYSISPKDMAYSLLGSTHHRQLNLAQFDSEHQFKGTKDNTTGDISGISDLIEPDEEKVGWSIITDYKTYGSYRVTKLLGLVKKQYPHPTEVYKKSGKWGQAGTPKTVTSFEVDPNQIDMEDEILQLNGYRMLAEKVGYKISKLQLQVTVRDGGLQVATNRGVTDNIYYPIPVPLISDQAVKDYFEPKRARLIHHLNTNTMPAPCTDKERWNGRKCVSYCDVSQYCPTGIWEKAQVKQKLEEKTHV
jgi:hypothetical protein